MARSAFLVVLLNACVIATNGLSLLTPKKNSVGASGTERRAFIKEGIPAVAVLLSSLPAFAETNYKELYRFSTFAQKSRRYAPGEIRAPDDFEQGMSSPFIGRYTDPKHPEGYRSINLSEKQVGYFRVASVKGNDGSGGPDFDLPALVFYDQITVDFSEKGGPPNLTGIFAGNAIRWPDGMFFLTSTSYFFVAGNKWPQVSTSTT